MTSQLCFCCDTCDIFWKLKIQTSFHKDKIVYLDVRSGSSSPRAKFDAFERNEKSYPKTKKRTGSCEKSKNLQKQRETQEVRKYSRCSFLAPIRVNVFGQVLILNWRNEEDFGVKSKPKIRKIHTGTKHRIIKYELTQKIFEIDSGFERKEKMENVDV